jgi:hypothetical protein
VGDEHIDIDQCFAQSVSDFGSERLEVVGHSSAIELRFGRQNAWVARVNKGQWYEGNRVGKRRAARSHNPHGVPGVRH